MIILGMDALDFGMVEKFGCKNLMQSSCGQTDISGFALERTVVLWASFITGQPMERRIPIKGQWEFKLGRDETFFRFFDEERTVDVPAYSLFLDRHRKEHALLAKYFDYPKVLPDFDKVVWENHTHNKKEFMRLLSEHISSDIRPDKKIIMGYFDLADAIGHLSFGDLEKMRSVYEELELLAGEVQKAVKASGPGRDDIVMIVSDHGMTPIGRFGDHTKNGFFSLSSSLGDDLVRPNITDFFEPIRRMAES
jgi:hypothetical protein